MQPDNDMALYKEHESGLEHQSIKRKKLLYTDKQMIRMRIHVRSTNLAGRVCFRWRRGHLWYLAWLMRATLVFDSSQKG